jgi:alkylhydroperoxidase/carboxymuconolactone decarboxylase family protein YurZ
MREDLEALRRATVDAALRGDGELPVKVREALARGEGPDEMRALVAKVRDHAYEVTDQDLDALRGRYSDDQLFEAVVAMVLGAADARLRAGLRVLEEA